MGNYEKIDRVIAFGECWQIARSKLTGIPVRHAVITAGGIAKELRNLRPFMYTFSSAHHRPIRTAAAFDRARLTDAIRAGDGHLGTFISSEGREYRQGEVTEDHIAELDELAAAENNLWLAFDTPDNRLGATHLALGRLCGFRSVDARRPLLPVVEGQDGHRGTLPPQYPEAWPYVGM